MEPNTAAIALMEFQTDDLVWCKLKGHPSWPAKVLNVYGKNRQMLEVYWFKDYRSSKVHKGQCKPFKEHAPEVEKDPTSSVQYKLNAAIQEALICYRTMQLSKSSK